MSASSAVFVSQNLVEIVSQNLVEPDAIDDDRESADFEVPDVALGNGLSSDLVPVLMLCIALQGLYIFR